MHTYAHIGVLHMYTHIHTYIHTQIAFTEGKFLFLFHWYLEFIILLNDFYSYFMKYYCLSHLL